MDAPKYFILLALAAGPLHGLAIRGQVIADTVGEYIRDSTLYPALKQLLERGWIAEQANGYRRVYALTAAGQQALAHEARARQRLAELTLQRLRMHV
ncbi:MAG TPA: helix-turn-helix transcriptional regulator [Candidatus Saccharimonadia bacterium]|nr:helix-turn-helix transcriptional regulator [Candidatus Saccharimonadia bacterium]